MTDREHNFVTREWAESKTIDIERRITMLERANATMQGALAVARFLGAGALAVSGALLVWIITRGAP